MALQKAVLTALGRYTNESIGQTVLKAYPTFSGDVKTVAQTLLASRKPWAKELLEAGVWTQVRDHQGRPYYLCRGTGEACADLELYLKIRRELDAAIRALR